MATAAVAMAEYIVQCSLAMAEYISCNAH